MSAYKWKTGTRMNVSAEIAGNVCAALEADGKLNGKNLVEISRPEDAPLHKCFEWNDNIAAERYREQQARTIINHLELVVNDTTPTRCFVTVNSFNGEYKSIDTVLKRKNTRAELLEQAYRDMTAFKRKYQTLEELAGVITAIDAMEETA